MSHTKFHNARTTMESFSKIRKFKIFHLPFSPFFKICSRALSTTSLLFRSRAPDTHKGKKEESEIFKVWKCSRAPDTQYSEK